MDRKTACLAQASACREKAQSDPANCDYWIDKSIRWLERAMAPMGGVAIYYEAISEHALPKDEISTDDGKAARKQNPSNSTSQSDPL